MNTPDGGAPALSTPRLRLRAPKAADAQGIAVLANDPDVARMTTRMPLPYSPADAEAFLKICMEHDPRRERVFAIEQADGEFVGMMGFHPNPAGRTEIGYWLGRPYWGRGLATEAARAALDWAGRDWGRRYILAGHFADNPASGQVLCKSGFLYTGDVEPRHSLARGAIADTRMMVWLA